MLETTIQKLANFGQSVWLDNISRKMIETGQLKKMVELGLRGMTSNPTIFDKTISSSNDYDETILGLSNLGKSTFEIYDDLTIKDIQDAADIFKPIYEKSERLDGYVSLEINPKLAYSSHDTTIEGKRLYQKVKRANIMFKVPATNEGFTAIEDLLARGINVNVTLIFSVEQYSKAAMAYMRGIKRLLENNGDASKVRSVASVFVSRIDTLVDKKISEDIKKENEGLIKNKLASFKGTAAIANSKLIYKKYLEILSSQEFKELADKGANIQRVLWGSTSTKNPAYSDIKYVTELIAKDTVNTMPEHTFEAFLDHGQVKEALSKDVGDALQILGALKGLGIDIDSVCAKLLREGVVAFENSFASLLNTIEAKKKAYAQNDG